MKETIITFSQEHKLQVGDFVRVGWQDLEIIAATATTLTVRTPESLIPVLLAILVYLIFWIITNVT